MTRISRTATLDTIEKNDSLKLAIVGHSKSGPGRTSILLRVPVTLQARMDRLTIGPAYLIYLQAMNEFLDRLEKAPRGSLQVIDAETFNPTPEDLALAKQLEAAKPPKATRRP